MSRREPDIFDAEDYWAARLEKHWGLDGVGRMSMGQAFNRWSYRIQRRVFLKRMRATGVDFHQAEVLDIGSGVGFFVDCWRALGARRIVGSDITQMATEQLRQKYPDLEFHQIDIGADSAPLPERSFDCISAISVLFHIVDDERYDRAFRNIHALLKPGGLFVFTEAAPHGKTIRQRHVVYRPLHTIQAILQRSGFDAGARAPFLYLMNYPDDSRSRLRHRSWQAMAKAVSLNEAVGFVTGAALYPLELACVSWAKESPSSEIFVCRKAK